MFKICKEDSIRLINVVGIISYTTVIIRFVMAVRIEGLLHPFNYCVNGIGLEVHGLTYMFMTIILYYWITRGTEYFLRDKLLWLIMLFIVLGNKRAAYLGALIVVVLYWALSKFTKHRKSIVLAVSMIVLISLFVCVVLIYLVYYRCLILTMILEIVLDLNFEITSSLIIQFLLS